jgi:HK97 gp10 family phage protein
MPVVIVGLDVALRFVERLPVDSKRAVDDLMGVGAELMRAQAVGLAPRRTGALKKSIMVEHTSFCEYTVGSDLGYSGFVEVGTSKMKAQPYLRPSWLLIKPRLKTSVLEVLEKYFSHRG